MLTNSSVGHPFSKQGSHPANDQYLFEFLHAKMRLLLPLNGTFFKCKSGNDNLQLFKINFLNGNVFQNFCPHIHMEAAF